MIPLYLKLSGIYSYRFEQEIDFKTLASSHLFGIFGAVGSGKSALLEAIMFALYGECERLNSREQRAYNMMNLKCNEAFIQFDFLAPSNKGTFRAIVKGKRNSRNKEDVKFERFLYHVEDGGTVPVDTAEIPEIIGLSYDHFRRTIIIPQGKFQEFLQLGAKDRTDMVKELFNLHRFDLSENTARLYKKNEDAYNNSLGKLQQLGVVSEEDILRCQEELDSILKELQEGEILLSSGERREKEMQQLSEAITSLEKNKNDLQSLQSRLPEIRKSEQLLNDIDECISNFKSDLDLLDDKKKQLDSGEVLFKERQERYKTGVIAHAELEERFEAAKKAFNSRETILQEARDLELCAKINTLAQQSSILQERISKGENEIENTVRDLESHKATAQLTWKNYETLKDQLPQLERLKSASEWHSQLKLLNERKASLLKAEGQSRDSLNSLDNQITPICARHGIAFQRSSSEFSEIIPALQKIKELTLEKLHEVAARLMHLETQEQLKAYASALQEGIPCPLCGSTDHPHVIELADFEGDLRKIRAERQELELNVHNIDTGLSKVEVLLGSRQRTLAEMEKVHQELTEYSTLIKSHLETNPCPGITEDMLNKQWSDYNRITEELNSLEKQVGEARGKAEREEENIKKYRAHLEKLKNEALITSRDISNLKDQLSLTDHSLYASTTVEAIMEKVDQLREKYRSCEETYRLIEVKAQTSRNELQTLNGILQKSTEDLKLQKEAIGEMSKQLEIRVLASKFRDESQIRELLLARIDRIKEQERIRKYYDSLSAINSAVVTLESQVVGKIYEREVHEQLKQEIRETKNRLDNKKERKGGLEANLLALKRDFAESVNLKKQIKSLEIRRENLKILSDLFRGQGFVNYVSTMYLQNLVNSANERFYRLVRQQLKLELDEDNNFRIRDYLNDGQWRNVKTLSGGQTFQASLCLALALADNIQQLNEGGQNFFFLDEGFGTLDRESLELVFDTLKSLRKENRLVGVISHVEDMQQEIGAWLKIRRDEELGSVVSASWA